METEMVQFVPCGHSSEWTKEEIRQTSKGAAKQLEDIENDVKYDAVILPSVLCGQCQSDKEERERRYAY